MSLSIPEARPQVDPALLDVVLFCPETPARRFLAHHRIEYFRCGQTKSQAFPNRGRPANEFAFLQLNPADWLNFLVVDVDDEAALLNLMHPAVPEPTWIIENPATGHAQAGWAIEPVYRGEGARPWPIRYAEAVQRALDRLVDGDPCFTRYLVRNPAAEFPAGRVWWGRRASPWSLGDLKAHMVEYIDPFHDEAIDGPAASAWDPGTALLGQAGVPRAPVVDTATEVGRNTAIFRATRRWLWDQQQIRHQTPNEAASIAHARALNVQLPHPCLMGRWRAWLVQPCGRSMLARDAPRPPVVLMRRMSICRGWDGVAGRPVPRPRRVRRRTMPARPARPAPIVLGNCGLRHCGCGRRGRPTGLSRRRWDVPHAP